MITFFLVCVSIGTSVAIDVSIVTVSRFREMLDFLTWTLPIALMHIAFISLGLYGAMAWLELAPQQSQFVFGGAAILVFWLCLEWSRDWRGASITLGPTALLSLLLHHFDDKIIRRVMVIVIISLDALLGSPSFSVAGRNWSDEETGVAILLIGATVMLWTIGSLKLAQKLRRHEANLSLLTLAKLSIAGKLFQLMVIGTFGIASFLLMLGYDLPKLASLCIAGFITLLYFSLHNQALLAREIEELVVS